MVKIVTRGAWGARPWSGAVHEVSLRERTFFVLHYHGGPPAVSIGAGVPREVDAIHHDNGWAGIGYNYVIDQAGTIYEGRGRDLVGAHCPGRNRDGLGVYLAVGGNQAPTDDAKRAARRLYEDLCTQAGRALAITYHGAHYATDCAGPHINPWAKAGMPLPASTVSTDSTRQEEDMVTDLSAQAVAQVSKAVWGPGASYRPKVAEGTGDKNAELADGRDAIAPVTALERLMDGMEQLRVHNEQRAATERRILEELAAIRGQLGK